MNRRARLMWMKDILEHMTECHREWQTADGRVEQYLADSIQRDLDEVRRLCQSLRSDLSAGERHGVCAA
ncbi:MAG: hypothetical protein WD847_16875 [Pirellulales bacterium]